jgi:hypothetical protein
VLLAGIVYIFWIRVAINHRGQCANQIAAVSKHHQSAIAIAFKREPLMYG